MNILIVALAIIFAALIPFGIGVYRDAKEKMKNLNERIKERQEYEKIFQEKSKKSQRDFQEKSKKAKT